MAKLEVHELPNGIKQIKLIGRLDIIGSGEIETTFAAHSASKKAKIIVDLSELDFLASIGIRLIISNAKAQIKRGGKIVLLNPNPSVNDVLKTAGIDLLIPLYHDLGLASEDLNSTVTE